MLFWGDAMKKRMLALLLAASMLAGCGAQTAAPTEVTTEAVTEPTEYNLPKEEGYNQLTFYWNGDTDLSKADVWVWWDGKDGSGHLFYPCDYGAKAMVNVPEGIEQVGFIVRYGCSDPGGNSWGSATKDYEQDRFAIMTGADTVIYLKTGEAGQYTSTDGGMTLDSIRKVELAAMTGFKTIRYNITPAVRITDLSQIRVLQEGKEMAVESVSSLNNQVNNGTVTLAQELDLTKTYQLVIDGFEPQTVVPTYIFDTKEFIENYTYDGNDLGAVISGGQTTFKVWAPTASRVVLNLFEQGHDVESYKTVDMVLGDRGVWSCTESCGHGTYYTYTVTTAVGTQEATDPYARAAGVNGDRSMVVDLSLTDPEKWEETPITLEKDSDAVIWEVHVRDFSNKIQDSQYKGKYLAFTERGLTNEAGVPVGVDYLVQLGITHVHLLPVYDYATVDEREGGFNWGYDPKNYNVPEGSYSTDPYNGQVRITEYKQMVQSLHDAGIGVVMDVVYNHTYDANSAFNKIVPYYYYRYNADGSNSSASGCGNDTASERYMFGKFMVDSVSYWASEYNLDGFRFDLMGLHDLQTMDRVQQAVHKINPSAIIYGEGWTMGSTVDGSAQADQRNIGKIQGISVFNDAIRDGLKGSVFDATSKGYISGEAKANAQKVIFGILGGKGMTTGWQVEDDRVINYMSAHDNRTLWDKLALSNADATVEQRLAMNRLGAAIIMMSRGTPFMQAGEEMLRTKGGDENSYNSGDEVNNIDWAALTPDSPQYNMMTYYKGLIALRKTVGGEASVKELAGGALVVTIGESAVMIINPTDSELSYTLEGEWQLMADGENAGTEPLSTATGKVTVAPVSVHIYTR